MKLMQFPVRLCSSCNGHLTKCPSTGNLALVIMHMPTSLCHKASLLAILHLPIRPHAPAIERRDDKAIQERLLHEMFLAQLGQPLLLYCLLTKLSLLTVHKAHLRVFAASAS